MKKKAAKKRRRSSAIPRAPKTMVGPSSSFRDGKARLAVRDFPEKGIVAIDFGQDIRGMGLKKDEAFSLAHLLIRHAMELP